jgi:hypothetical protein
MRARPLLCVVAGAFGARGSAASRPSPDWRVAGERAECPGAPRPPAGIPPARVRWPRGRHATSAPDPVTGLRACAARCRRASGRNARVLRTPPPEFRPLASVRRTGGTRPVRRTGCGPRVCTLHAARGRAGGRPGCCARHLRDFARSRPCGGQEAHDPPGGPVTGLPSGLRSSERAEDRRRTRVDAGVPPARARVAAASAPLVHRGGGASVRRSRIALCLQRMTASSGSTVR